MTTLFSKIKEVTELSAISGHEAPVRAYLREKLTPHVDEVVTDGLGGIFGIKRSEAADAPRVLVASHMDEVGFMVSEIKPDGTFRVVEIGGWNPMVVSSQRFKCQLLQISSLMAGLRIRQKQKVLESALVTRSYLIAVPS